MTALDGHNVSRETLDLLKRYEALLVKWNSRINLVSRNTIDDLWKRHFADAAQLYELVDGPVGNWVDIGSGGGFPGLVVAMLDQEKANIARMTLVESDQRKCAFLRTVIRETRLDVRVVCGRAEEQIALDADILSARALAPLPTLFEYASVILNPSGTCIFPKGKNWRLEVKDAESRWNFNRRIVNSVTNPESVIICATGVERV